MPYYNLEEKKGKNRFTDFEIYYYGAGREELELERHFQINIYGAFKVSKNYGDLQEEFIKELQELKNSLYDYVYNEVERRRLKCTLPKETDYKIQQAELKKIYDYFLPKQKAFAEKWGLRINVD